MNRTTLPAWLAIVLLLAGCTGTDADGDAASAGGRTAAGEREPAVETPPLPQAPAARPDTVHGTILLEGMADSMTFILYESPAGFPVPFSTYVPRDMTVDAVSSGEGDAFVFVAAFGGQRNDDVYLGAFFPPAGTDEAGARALTRTFAESRGIRERDPGAGNRFDWSIVEHDFRQRQPDGDVIVGTVALGRHGDRFFTIASHYPEPYADGFGPRAHRILETWRWEDDGTSLGGEAGPLPRDPGAVGAGR